MNPADECIALLREISANQATQTDAVVRAMKTVEESQNAYVASRIEYEQDQERSREEYRKSQELYRRDIIRRGAILATFLGIIAICMVTMVVLQLLKR